MKKYLLKRRNYINLAHGYLPNDKDDNTVNKANMPFMSVEFSILP